ncbi:putative (acyl-carrier-protein) phosphodiesterase [gamma proteobacterium IMCC1989]|nr:putative (acyl-carrier-protein) phosphodiesterase [gamma proteobacterium IMCC1989]
MKKILLVSYTPRIDSNTQKLVDAYLQATGDTSQITPLDLVKEPAPLLLDDHVNALLKRNYMGMALTDAESKSIQKIDALLQQLLDTDRIVIAFPMYNFSVPATVKAWIDTLVQNGKTFKITDDGAYEGLCHGKKALILMTTGGDYSEEPMKSMDYAVPLIQSCFGFMGIESHAITAYGLNQYMDRADDIVHDAQQEIARYVSDSSSW